MDHRRLNASPPPLHVHRCWKIQRSQSWNGGRLGWCLTRDMRAIPIGLCTAMGIAAHALGLDPRVATFLTRKVAKPAVVRPLWRYISSWAGRPAGRCELAMT